MQIIHFITLPPYITDIIGESMNIVQNPSIQAAFYSDGKKTAKIY